MNLHNDIFLIGNEKEFTEIALAVFNMQADNVPVYKQFINHLHINPSRVKSIKDIPFLPIELFKSHKIIHKDYTANLIFESSGTTGMNTSRHYVASSEIYKTSLINGFIRFYGSPDQYAILALLPSYLERNNSSLVYMVKYLIEKTSCNYSGFYLNEYEKLIATLYQLRNEKKKIILIGVSFALLELAEKYQPDLSGIIVMETGGMKGKRPEITRDELHQVLKKNLNLETVHSEYGMTEILSQAYSKEKGIYQSPPWMKILIRDPYDPRKILDKDASGGINVIDLANLYSCSFLATSDLGKIIPRKGFEISGRLSSSDIRGCNLLFA